jgi:hypothetical protein
MIRLIEIESVSLVDLSNAPAVCQCHGAYFLELMTDRVGTLPTHPIISTLSQGGYE